MKRIVLVILVLAISRVAFADFKVVYDKASKEVVFIAEKGNVKISSEDNAKLKTVVMKGTLESYDLQEQHSDYKIVNNKFIVNVKKISDREIAREEETIKQSDMKLIQNKAYKIACDALIANGINLVTVKCSDFE